MALNARAKSRRYGISTLVERSKIATKPILKWVDEENKETLVDDTMAKAALSK